MKRKGEVSYSCAGIMEKRKAKRAKPEIVRFYQGFDIELKWNFSYITETSI